MEIAFEFRNPPPPNAANDSFLLNTLKQWVLGFLSLKIILLSMG